MKPHVFTCKFCHTAQVVIPPVQTDDDRPITDLLDADDLDEWEDQDSTDIGVDLQLALVSGRSR